MPIDDFSYGRIVIDGREERRDLILTQQMIHSNWWRDQGHRLRIDDLEIVLDARPDVLVVGTGTDGRMHPEQGLEQALADRGIRMESMQTDAAVERVNALLREGANVAAALHLTC